MNKQRKGTLANKGNQTRRKTQSNRRTSNEEEVRPVRTRKRSNRESLKPASSHKIHTKESVKRKKQLRLARNESKKQDKRKMNNSYEGFEMGNNLRDAIKDKRGRLRAVNSGNKLGGLTNEKNKLIMASLMSRVHPMKSSREKEVMLYSGKRLVDRKTFESERQTAPTWKREKGLPIKKRDKKTNIYCTLDGKVKEKIMVKRSKTGRQSIGSNLKKASVHHKKEDSLTNIRSNRHNKISITNRKNEVIGRKRESLNDQEVLLSRRANSPKSHNKKRIDLIGKIPKNFPVKSFHRKSQTFICTERKDRKSVRNLKKKKGTKKTKTVAQISQKETKRSLMNDSSGIFYTKEISLNDSIDQKNYDILQGFAKSKSNTSPTPFILFTSDNQVLFANSKTSLEKRLAKNRKAQTKLISIYETRVISFRKSLTAKHLKKINLISFLQM